MNTAFKILNNFGLANRRTRPPPPNTPLRKNTAPNPPGTVQEERNARSEAEATLRGTILALEAQLAAAEASSRDAAERRLQASEDANRVREELGKTTTQRDQLQENLARLQEELSRWVGSVWLGTPHVGDGRVV